MGSVEETSDAWLRTIGALVAFSESSAYMEKADFAKPFRGVSNFSIITWINLGMRMSTSANIQADRNKLFSQTLFEPTWSMLHVVRSLGTMRPDRPEMLRVA
jgi:hypothetical protein